MSSERWSRLKAIFHGAIERPADIRRAWAREQCASDDVLWREVEALLDKYDTGDNFLVTPAQLDPADIDPLSPGATLGPYHIVRKLGAGGMGVVYLARDNNLERDVAIKTLPPVLATNPNLRERLRREAKAAVNIKHDAVATVYVLDEIDGHLVIVSDYVPGDTLRTILASGAIEETRACAIAVDIAGALAAAHDARVIHRDLKPENVIVTPTGEVKVIDFGIAQIEGDNRITIPGVMVGTPAYMSPEQIAGGPVTARSDVYSFGVVFREMLTGKHPLAGDGGPVKTISPHLATIIARCMNRDPDDRYSSGRELLAALTAKTTPIVPQEDTKIVPGSPRWWWEFHQAFIAVLYWLMTWPAWTGRQIVGGPVGRALFMATLIAVIVATTLRLHLWFMSRFSPTELRSAQLRAAIWIRLADWLFVASLATTGILVGEDQSPIAILLLAVAVGALIAFLVIERATAQAAFRHSTT